MNGAASTWRTALALPRLELDPFTPAELHALRRGDPDADVCEHVLATSARAHTAIVLAIADGLHALRQGDRLAQLGCHLDDYAREVLGIGRRSAQQLARLGRELRTRPLLRAALRAGRVGLRAAETILPVAVGEAEAAWVELAAVSTIRELEAAVRRARDGAADDGDEDWFSLRTQLPSDARALVDAALDLAGRVLPGSTRLQRLEAIAQEYLGELPGAAGDDPAAPLDPTFRPLAARESSRRAVLEAETERWSLLSCAPEVPAPDVAFPDSASAAELDARLRELAALLADWDDLLGLSAHAVQKSGIHRLLGFHDFRHYCDERLGLPARAVEQRAAVHARLAASPALREARRQRLPYEKLRLLARLPEADLASWTPRAHALTCIALSRAVDTERERQLRARATFGASLPRRVAVLLSAAIRVVRERVGCALPAGKCLAVLAAHFVATWWEGAPRSRSRAEKVRERDHGHCRVPGCSHHARHSHHLEFRSHGGSDALENQLALCPFHHLRCVHGGWLRVAGRAPDALTWLLGGKPWNGPRFASAMPA